MNYFEKILKKVDSYEYISFDVFDTLIKRDLYKPTDIFLIVQNRYNETNKNKIYDFYNKRTSAEKNARNYYKNGEVDINEIYEYYECESIEIKDKLKQLEIAIEKEYCRQNINIRNIYEYCRKKGKKIIAISDMYLKKEQINEILNINGIKVDNVFVSNEFRENKKTGKLFQCALDYYSIKPNQIIHIGDSYKADYIGALRKKIRPIHIKKRINRLAFDDYEKIDNYEISKSIIASTINNTIDIKKDYFYKIGYEICGPIFLNFILWINKISKNNNIDNLLFCARDMKLVQEMYNYLIDDGINNSYFYVSRKSTYLPYLYSNKSYDNFKKLIPIGSRRYKINDLLHLFSIDKISDEILKKYEIDPKKIYSYDEIIKSQSIEKLYNEVIEQYIEKEGQKQYNYFISYLKKLNISKNTSIVDLGWRGTTQKILIDVLKYDIKGIYFGLTEQSEKLKNKCYAYLFEEIKNDNSKKVYSCMSLIELIFSALHGSTLLYSSDKQRPYILGESSNKNSKVIMEIQNGIKDFCYEIKKHIKDITTDNEFIYETRFLDICTNPSLNDAKKFGDLNTENIVERKIACPKSMIYYAFHIKQLKKDFIDSEYKIGFMKRLLIIKINYFKLYSYLKKR